MKASKGHGLYEICNEYRERDQVGLSHLLQEEEEGRGMNIEQEQHKKKLNYGEYIHKTDGYMDTTNNYWYLPICLWSPLQPLL